MDRAGEHVFDDFIFGAIGVAGVCLNFINRDVIAPDAVDRAFDNRKIVLCDRAQPGKELVMGNGAPNAICLIKLRHPINDRIGRPGIDKDMAESGGANIMQECCHQRLARIAAQQIVHLHEPMFKIHEVRVNVDKLIPQEHGKIARRHVNMAVLVRQGRFLYAWGNHAAYINRIFLRIRIGGIHGQNADFCQCAAVKIIKIITHDGFIVDEIGHIGAGDQIIVPKIIGI